MKILYIDIPFKSRPYSARQKRSELLLSYCQKENELDLVLFCNDDDFYESEKNIYSNQLSILRLENSSYEDKKYNLAEGETKKLAQILNNNKYELVFIREINFYPLIDLIDFYLPDAKIIIDQTHVDEFVSENKKNKIFGNYFSLSSSLKNSLTFKNIFFTFPSQKSQFLFRQLYMNLNMQTENKMFVLDNPIGCTFKTKGPYIGPNYFLLYGDFSKAKNSHALETFLKKHYNEIYQNLQATDSYLYLLGNNVIKAWEFAKKTIPLVDRINPIGPVKNIQKYIVNSKCIIIPDEEQGTNYTRLFETISQNKYVITDSAYTDLKSELILKETNPGELHKTLNQYMLKDFNGLTRTQQSIINIQSFNEFAASIFKSTTKSVA